jgi:transmembrane sensor
LKLSERSSLSRQESEALEQQAHAWVRQFSSGGARARDARALQRWCATSDAHAQAFKKAHRLWKEMGPAAELAGAGDAELAALRATPHGSVSRGALSRVLPRRAFLGTGIAAAAAAAGVAIVHPPLGLWPSSETWQADYRTGPGEQKKLALAPDVTVEMNTRSSLALQAGRGDTVGETVGIELIGGEVAVDATRQGRPFSVSAGAGRMQAVDARFEVRHTDGQSVCVSCFEGRVQVAVASEEIALRAAQQVVYDGSALQPVRDIEAAERSAWREGILSFQRTALAQVVAEINRYRAGRVVLLGRELDAKPVSGRFNIAELDKAIAQIQRLFRLEATTLPGGIVILR